MNASQKNNTTALAGLYVDRKGVVLADATVQTIKAVYPTSAEYPRDLCIQQLFEAQVELTPTALAVVQDGRQLTYQELNERANQLAHRIKMLGVGANSLVGVHANRSLDYVICVLAILKAGGAYVPLDTGYPPQRLNFMIRDASLKIVITDQPLPASLDLGDSIQFDLKSENQSTLACAKTNLPCINRAEHPAYVIYTSGSTGQPKGVVVPHRGVVRLVKGQTYADFNASQRFLLLASTSFDAATFELWGALLNGATCVVFSGQLQSFNQLESAIRRHGVTCLFLTTGLFNQIIDVRPSVLETVQHVLTGGEAMSVAHMQKAIQQLPSLSLTNIYGPTESTTFACYHPIKKDDALPNNSVPIGRPIAHTECHVLDENMQPAPLGLAGELFIGGDGLACGYLNRPELTAEKFIAHPLSKVPGARLYRTGDLCRYLPDGNLEFIGRMDNQVKIRGFRIELGEIEAALAGYPGILNAVVAAREDVPGNKQLVAYLVTKPGVSLMVSELRNHLLQQLPDYMVPASFMQLEKLPLTANGKVDRNGLPAPDEKRLLSESEFVAPRTPTETALASIWSSLLPAKKIGIHDNFFALGGHSLLGLKTIYRIRETLGVDMPVKMLLQNPTIAQLGKVVDLAANETGKSAPSRPQRQSRPSPDLPAQFPVSYNQQQLWFIDQLEPGNPAYNIPLVIRLKGHLNQEALQKSLNHLIERQEVLRTVFQVAENEPVQIVLPKLEIKLPVVALENLSAAELESEVNRRITAAAERTFDLSRGPLIWGELLRLDPTDHILLLTIHHIVFDGWSVNILLQELTDIYGAADAGETPRLPELPLQYADFAAWQRNVLRDETLAGQLQFWKERLGGTLPMLELPSDHPRPTKQSFRGGQEEIILSKELADRLQAMSQGEGVTLFMTMLAAFNILLHRHTSLEDISVGTPSVIRNQAETEKLVGFFVNVLVLRSDLSGDPSFRQLLRQVREVCLDAYAHEDVPFEKLVQELRPERRQDRTPLFQVMLNFLSLPDFHCKLPGLEVALAAESGVQSKFDLTLYVAPSSQGIRLHFVYNADIFAKPRMAEMLRQFRQLLEQAANRPDEKISRFNLVTPESKAVLPDPTQPLCPAWAGPVADRFSAQAREHPQQTAVEDTRESWGYQELENRSNQLAHCLCAHGLAAGDVVAIYSHRGASLVWALLGVWKAGAAFMILDPAHPATRLLECLKSAQPKAWIQIKAAGQLPEPLEKYAAGLACRLELPSRSEAEARRHLHQYSTDQPGRKTGPDDLAYVAFTSGSTGAPKGILGTHRPLSHFLDWHSAQFHLGETDRFSMLSGLSHDPLLRDIFTPLWLGATLCIPEPTEIWDPHGLRKWLTAKQITTTHLVPSLGQMLVESMQGETLPSLRHVFFGGEILRRSLAGKIRNLAPSVTCVNYYGTTETPQGVGYYVLPTETADQPDRLPVGKGIDGVQLLVLNPAGQLSGIGELGQIAVRTPYLTERYLGDETLTQQKFIINPGTRQPADRIYLTGDLARFLPDGNIQLQGRNDDQVKIRGFRIELGEIEAALLKHPLIRQAVVAVREDAPGDPQLAAYLVTQGGRLPGVIELRTFLIRHLPDYMVPTLFEELEKLPLTPNGKVDRKALAARPRHPLPPSDTTNQSAPPRNPLELQILLVWERILKVDAIGVRDNFFDLGGHSLLAVRLVNEINKTVGSNLSIPVFFLNPTIEGIALAITKNAPGEPQPQLIRLRSGQAGRSLFFLDASMGLCQLAQLLDVETSSFATTVPLPAPVIQAAIRNDKRGLLSLEQLAAPHTALIQKYQPAGTCLLAGHSFGGLLAFEVAHQLQQQGRQVEMIVLLDAWAAYPPWWQKIKVLSMARFWSSLRFRMRHGWSKQRDALKRALGRKPDAPVPRKEPEVSQTDILHPVGEISWGVFKRINWHARNNYQARPLPSRAVLFRALQGDLASYYPVAEHLGWDGLLEQGLEVIDTPGDHFTLLKEPNLQILAQQLNQRLKKIS